MNHIGETFIGIDVGGATRGFHAVALQDGKFVGIMTDTAPEKIVCWCLKQKAISVGVDAPCKWSCTGKSRLAERELATQGIFCFATPSRDRAIKRSFYDWVFNGERLYEQLKAHYHLFDGKETKEKTCFETFPHAVVCALAGEVVPARPKSKVRREALRRKDYDDSNLPNIDFVDAALCAVTANEFLKGNYQSYGNKEEGYILIPKALEG
jgi:predicted nuclease with RNAse H fold